MEGALKFATEVAEKHSQGGPLPLVRNLKVTHPNADAYFQFARNTVGAMARNFPAPLKCVDAVAASAKSCMPIVLPARAKRLSTSRMCGFSQLAIRPSFFMVLVFRLYGSAPVFLFPSPDPKFRVGLSPKERGRGWNVDFLSLQGRGLR